MCEGVQGTTGWAHGHAAKVARPQCDFNAPTYALGVGILVSGYAARLVQAQTFN